MTKKRGKKKEERELPFALQKKTKYWIFSIVSFTFSLFFILGVLDKGGVAGEVVYERFLFLFGTGYYLFAFIFFALGITFLGSFRPKFIVTSGTGAFFLFLSGLSIIEIVNMGGGIIGKIITSPLLALLDFYASLSILVAIFLTSLLLIFDKTPSLEWIRVFFLSLFRGKPEDATDDTKILNSPVNDVPSKKEDDAEKEELDENRKSEEVLPKQTITSSLFSSKEPVKKLPSHGFSSMYVLPGNPYIPPPLTLLDGDRGKPGVGDIKANANVIKRTLQHFGINVEMDEISIGPSVTRYALKPAQGVKLSRIIGLQNDLSLALAAHPLRIEAPIPGKSLVGIEIPNNTRTTVGLGTLLGEQAFGDETKSLLFSLGRSVTGKPFIGDLAKMPHLLIAGATGSGKSVAIHTIIASLLYRNSPHTLRLILIDPKRVELTLYNTIPHLLTPVITDAKKAILALKWAAREMDRRYDIFETEKVRDIASYHKNIVEPAYEHFVKNSDKKTTGEKAVELPEQIPYIIIIIDELADIMSSYPRELESAIVRLAQMSRATGIHLILSTQRPSVNILTGIIKANIPARMAFQVASLVDSRTILDMSGAEKLLGAGDMLYLSGEMSKPVRLQSAFISESEIKKIAKHLGKQTDEALRDLSITETEEQNSSDIFDAVADDEEGDGDDVMYEEARAVVMQTGKASTTYLQRKLRIGYARAARLMDILEERGIVGPPDGAKQRTVLMRKEEDENKNDFEENITS